MNERVYMLCFPLYNGKGILKKSKRYIKKIWVLALCGRTMWNHGMNMKGIQKNTTMTYWNLDIILLVMKF